MKDMRFIGYIILSMLAGVYTAKAQTVLVLKPQTVN